MGNKILVVIVVIVVAAGGFFAGMKYQQSQASAVGGQERGAGGFAQGGAVGANGAFRRNGGQNGQAVRGQIVSIDNGTATIKLRDGSTKLVVLSNSTAITKAAAGTKDDLKAGEQVMVFGSNNSDGSVTAQVVQLNPMFRGPSGAPRSTNNTTNTIQ